MPFTAAELENITNSMMDYHWNTPEVRKQAVQDMPLLSKMREMEESVPGNQEYVDFRVRGRPETTIQGFENDDSVDYGNPTGTKRGKAQWKLHHCGIKVTIHELLKAGISITDTTTGKGEADHDKREKVALTKFLKEKLVDMSDGFDTDMNALYWGDGTADSKKLAGIRSIILDDPTSATVVLGIDQSANDWWRNRASLGLTGGTPANQVVVTKLQNEWRQLRRFRGRPDTVLAGSAFLDQVEQELRAKGNYTLEGWTSKGKTDASIADVSFKGVNFTYDPTLDDLGREKYCYVLDSSHIKPFYIDGENMKKHNPARPENKYVMYRAMTYVGGLFADQRNCHGVYSIA